MWVKQESPKLMMAKVWPREVVTKASGLHSNGRQWGLLSLVSGSGWK